MNKNELLVFADENKESLDIIDSWKIIVADDEEEVHTVTKMVLKDVLFNSKNIKLLHAFSGEETKKLINENPDTAIILLDIVMENDDAGLDVIKYIRDDIKNEFVRIVIRTGQPGQAPEKDVIVNYDINDYKEKAELTSQKLFSTVIASLRSFDNFITIDNNRKGLKKIIESSNLLFNLEKKDEFSDLILSQLASLITLGNQIKFENISGFIAGTGFDGKYRIISGLGSYKKMFSNKKYYSPLPKDLSIINKIEKIDKFIHFENNWGSCFIIDKSGMKKIIYLEKKGVFTESTKYLLEILGSNIIRAYNNIILTDDIEKTQKEIFYTLGEVVETRSKETGFHVKRVAEYSKLIAEKYGLGEEEVELLKQASPLHDVGKVGIPDHILNKEGKLTREEFEIIKTHTTIGNYLFKRSRRKILQTAAIIALQHHERFNGEGYPQGLYRDNIHIYGRITCLADIFDAIGSDRIYKKAWHIEKALNYIKEQRGVIFDPDLVDIFFNNIDEILDIRKRFSEI